MTDFSFLGSFNMGYEGFSRPLSLARQHPVYGNRSEFLALLGLAFLIPLVKNGRKNKEEALRAEVKTTNRYAELPLEFHSRLPSKWTA